MLPSSCWRQPRTRIWPARGLPTCVGAELCDVDAFDRARVRPMVRRRGSGVPKWFWTLTEGQLM
jgi:hypothetical protein